MKKLTVLLCSVLMLLFTVGNANALLLTEAFTGSELFSEGEAHVFQFDFVGAGTNDTAAGLAMTSNVIGAAGPFYSVTLFVDFLDNNDADLEKPSIQLRLLTSDLTEIANVTAELGTGDTFFYSLTADQLIDFNSDLSPITRIQASSLAGYDNEFTITRVAFSASTTPVSEPATMLLLGSGLIGLAGFGRKKLFKK